MYVLAENVFPVAKLMAQNELAGNEWAYLPSEKRHLEPSDFHFFKRFDDAELFKDQTVMELPYVIVPLEHLSNVFINEIQSNTTESEPFKLENPEIYLDVPWAESETEKNRLLENSVDKLSSTMHAFGFGDLHNGLIKLNLQFQHESFDILHKEEFEEGKMAYHLHFSKTSAGDGSFTGYDAVFTRPFVIPHQEFNGINTAHLDRRMALIDWSTVSLDPVIQGLKYETSMFTPKDTVVGWLVHELGNLADTGDQGKELARLLQYKHWSGTHNENYIDGLNEIKSRFSKSVSIHAEESLPITKVHAYNLLAGRSVGIPLSGTNPGTDRKVIWFYLEGQQLKSINGLTAEELEKNIAKDPIEVFNTPGQKEHFISSLMAGAPSIINYNIENDSQPYLKPLQSPNI